MCGMNDISGLTESVSSACDTSVAEVESCSSSQSNITNDDYSADTDFEIQSLYHQNDDKNIANLDPKPAQDERISKSIVDGTSAYEQMQTSDRTDVINQHVSGILSKVETKEIKTNTGPPKLIDDNVVKQMPLIAESKCDGKAASQGLIPHSPGKTLQKSAVATKKSTVKRQKNVVTTSQAIKNTGSRRNDFLNTRKPSSKSSSDLVETPRKNNRTKNANSISPTKKRLTLANIITSSFIMSEPEDSPRSKFISRANSHPGNESKVGMASQQVVITRKTLDKLSKPREIKRANSDSFAKLSDVDNCVFHPNRKRSNTDTSTVCTLSSVANTKSFLARMEAKEKERQQKLLRDKMEAEYRNKVDKKRCPRCGIEQSYDEMITNRTQCPNDGCDNCEYLPPCSFNMARFESRMKKSSKRREESMRKVEEERERSRQPLRNNSPNRKSLRVRPKLEVGSFMERMSSYRTKKNEKLKKMEEDRKRKEEELCPFKPELNTRAHTRPKTSINSREEYFERLSRPKQHSLAKPLVAPNAKIKKKRTKSNTGDNKQRKLLNSTTLKRKSVNGAQQKKTKGKNMRRSDANFSTKKSTSHEGLAAKFEKLLTDH